MNTWNGHWSGEGKEYRRKMVLKADEIRKLPFELDMESGNDFYYAFGDGWGVNVHLEVMSASEAKRLISKSAGFMGYDWMIDSVLKNGEIIPERK